MNKVLPLLSFLLAFSLILPSSVIADKFEVKHLPLLAVQELPDGSYKGSTADLFLEIREGDGRVFLDTSPLTKIDTQISTRYAKDIACNYYDLDCDNYDFIYTIRAKSSIIGGPSAGAAIAALTTIAVLDLDYDETIAITGTINSGGIVGPVGGVKEKVKVAAEEGLSIVLVPLGSVSSVKEGNSSNETVDIIKSENVNESNKLMGNPYENFIDYNVEDLSIEVIEVTDLNDLIYYLSGKELKSNGYEFEVDSGYNDIMQELEEILCNRAEELEQKLRSIFDFENLSSNDNSSIFFDIDQKKNLSIQAKDNGDYYSSASFCFGLNVYIQYQIYDQKKLSEKEIEKEINLLGENLKLLMIKVNSEEIETISDLQTKMVVKERLNEVEEYLKEINEKEDRAYHLSYAKERLYSAIAWMQFFQMDGKKFVLDDQILLEVCNKKIAESEERYQYVQTYFPVLDLDYIREKIDLSRQSIDKKDYALCLVKASQAKAEASTILSSLGVTNENLKLYFEGRLKSVERMISENIEEEIFPILGYSYYQYGKTLGADDATYSSMLYLEYALELSDLDIYFPEEKGVFSKISFDKDIGVFMNGFLQGLLVGLLIMWLILQGVGRKDK